MEIISALFNFLLSLAGIPAILACLIGLLMAILITTVYFWGFMYDSVFGDVALQIGKWMGGKIPKLKEIKHIRNIWAFIQPRKMYVRYETPLCMYWLSHITIMLLALFMPENLGGVGKYIIATMIYLGCYFIGMRRKYKRMDTEYDKVLQHNLEFLKLSFLPITFVITVLGFLFTATGSNIQSFSNELLLIGRFVKQTLSLSDTPSILEMLLKLVAVEMGILILLYIVSLPLQVVSFL